MDAVGSRRAGSVGVATSEYRPITIQTGVSLESPRVKWDGGSFGTDGGGGSRSGNDVTRGETIGRNVQATITVAGWSSGAVGDDAAVQMARIYELVTC